MRFRRGAMLFPREFAASDYIGYIDGEVDVQFQMEDHAAGHRRVIHQAFIAGGRHVAHPGVFRHCE